MTNQTITGSRLTGYIVNVMRSPVIERLMVRGSQVAIKHVIHDMVTRTLLMELRRHAIKRWVPCGGMDPRLKIPHSAKVECGFRTAPEECLYDSGLIGHQYRASQYNTIQYNAIIIIRYSGFFNTTLIWNHSARISERYSTIGICNSQVILLLLYLLETLMLLN